MGDRGEYSVPGFRASSARAGIKKGRRKDLALFFSEKPSVSSVVFTRNLVKAAPLIWAGEKAPIKSLRGVLVNSGNANACTGAEGVRKVKALSKGITNRLQVPDDSLLLSSTGVIGVPLQHDKILRTLDRLVSRLSPLGFVEGARAIMTTDSKEKIDKSTFEVDGREVTVLGVAKGAGMISPNMATLLAFFFTDCTLLWDDLERVFKRCIDKSFNRIIVDGDTSTNDTAAILANGASWPVPLKGRDLAAFEECLLRVTSKLALKIVSDGEGATRVVMINVTGAISKKDAEKVARAIGTSLLVKTAIYGADLNWGRFVAAAGRAGVNLDPHVLRLYVDGIRVFGPGMKPEEKGIWKARGKVSNSTYEVTLDLGSGKGAYSVYTSDITHEYVAINSEYTT